MRDEITRFLDTTGDGILTAAEARREGWSPDVVRRLRAEGVIVRIARGVYVSRSRLHPHQDEVERQGRSVAAQVHLTRTEALLRGYGARVAASHQSALLVWDLPPVRSALDRVHLVHTTPGRTTRRHTGFTIHANELAGVVVAHEGRRVVTVALAVIGTALTTGLLAGVIAMDAALQKKLTTREEVSRLLDQMRHTPHLTAAREALARADGLAESPKESELRLLLVRIGLAVVAQFWIRTSNGRFYRVDFYLPLLGVILEYDGRVKYASSSSLTAEKSREDDLRLDGFGVGRVQSSHLNPGDLRRIVLAAAAQAQPRARGRSPEPPTWAA